MTEKKENAFEDFLEKYERKEQAKQATKANTSQERIGSRNYAISFLSSLSPDSPLANPQTLQQVRAGDQYTLDNVLTGASALEEERFAKVFNKDNLEKIIGDMPVKSVAKNFANYQPVEIRDNDWHNERAKAHIAYSLFERAEQGDQQAIQQIPRLVQNLYSEKIEQDAVKVKKALEDEGISERTITLVLGGLVQAYSSVRPPQELAEELCLLHGSRLSE